MSAPPSSVINSASATYGLRQPLQLARDQAATRQQDGAAMSETDPQGIPAAISAFNAATTTTLTRLAEVKTAFDQVIGEIQQIKVIQTGKFKEIDEAMNDLHSALDELIDTVENEESDETVKI